MMKSLLKETHARILKKKKRLMNEYLLLSVCIISYVTKIFNIWRTNFFIFAALRPLLKKHHMYDQTKYINPSNNYN